MNIYIFVKRMLYFEIIKIAKTYKLLNNCNMYAHKTWNIYFTKIAIIWRRVDPDIFAARYACMQCVKYSRSFPPGRPFSKRSSNDRDGYED